MQDLKEQILKRFLDFVLRYVPLETAQLGGLGGQGIEAKIWADRGIPHTNGWIVERGQSSGAKLIAGSTYNVQNQLSTLSRVMCATRGKGAALDGFHLDLCGTVSEEIMSDFKTVFELVLKSRGRSLAVTVADARRNTALENWPQFMSRAWDLLDCDAPPIYKAITHEQLQIPVVRHKKMPAFMKSFDPKKAAKREFALFVELAELFHQYAFDCVTVKRFVYVSRYSGRPFRMRTYFFHFEPTHTEQPAALLAKSWLGSPLTILKADGVVQTIPAVRAVVIQSISQPTTKTVPMTKENTSKLGQLASLLGGEYASEYEALLADKSRLQTITNAVQGLGISPGRVTKPPETDKPGEFRVTKETRSWEDFNDQEQIEWLLETLELRAQSGNHWKSGQWEELLRKKFGRYSAKLGRTMRGALAHTGGKFRPQFIARINEVYPGASARPYLERVSRLPA